MDVPCLRQQGSPQQVHSKSARLKVWETDHPVTRDIADDQVQDVRDLGEDSCNELEPAK